jgi:drug/metabolite transporter (DMT)-like permease
MPAVLFGVLAALAWSVHDVIARNLAARVGPFRMAALVMIGGGLLLSAAIWWTGGLARLHGVGLASAALMGFAYGLGAGGLFKAFSYAPLSVVAPVTATYPVLVVVWGVANGLAPTLVQWLAVLAAMAGAVTVARSGHADGGINAVAKGKLPALFFFCAMSGAGYAAAVILGQMGAVEIGEIETAWLSRPAALVTILPFMLGEARTAPLLPRHWLSVLAMSAADIAGVIAVNASGHLADKDFAAIGISAYGILAVLSARLFLKESVSPGQWTGIVLIVAGVSALSLAG